MSALHHALAHKLAEVTVNRHRADLQGLGQIAYLKRSVRDDPAQNLALTAFRPGFLFSWCCAVLFF